MLSIPNQLKSNLKSVDEIVDTICALFNVKRFDLFSNKRHDHLVDARLIVYHILHFHPLYRMNITQIARLFDKDHTSILHQLKAIEKKPYKRNRTMSKLRAAHYEIFGHYDFMQPYISNMRNTGKNSFVSH